MGTKGLTLDEVAQILGETRSARVPPSVPSVPPSVPEAEGEAELRRQFPRATPEQLIALAWVRDLPYAPRLPDRLDRAIDLARERAGG